MTQLQSLKVSLSYFAAETANIQRFVKTNFYSLLFHINNLDDMVDAKNYLGQLKAIKAFASQLEANEDTALITEKLAQLPLLREPDFEISIWKLPAYILFIFLPLGIFVWLTTYTGIVSLQRKLNEMDGPLGTLEFLLKAQTGS